MRQIVTHCYNQTPLHCHKWQTLYFILHESVLDISHLKVFGCGAYVHILKDVHINGLSHKSGLMVYLGHTDGIKASVFMRLSNNTVFTSITTLFDETLYPKCLNACVCETIHVNEPRAQQLPHDADEDTIPGDLDDISIPSTKREPISAEPDGANTSVDIKDDKAVPQPSPLVPDPIPLRRSTQLRKVLTHSGNIYGKDRHPTKIETDMQCNRIWR